MLEMQLCFNFLVFFYCSLFLDEGSPRYAWDATLFSIFCLFFIVCFFRQGLTTRCNRGEQMVADWWEVLGAFNSWSVIVDSIIDHPNQQHNLQHCHWMIISQEVNLLEVEHGEGGIDCNPSNRQSKKMNLSWTECIFFIVWQWPSLITMVNMTFATCNCHDHHYLDFIIIIPTLAWLWSFSLSSLS